MSKDGVLGFVQHLLKNKPADDKPAGVFETYEERSPHHQNAIDLLDGWNSGFPAELGLTAGAGTLFHDNRIYWSVEQLGSIEGKSILELGPLEASHTMILERYNPASITAIEAHKAAYLKCLVAKEIYNLQKSHFLLGDFVKFLEETDQVFDVIVASGVLYHMKDPIHLLELIGSRANAIFLWTHYFDEEAMPKDDDRRLAFIDEPKTVTMHGKDMRLYKRSYYNAWKKDRFCGGPENYHYWMEKNDIIHILQAHGFGDIRENFIEPDHQNGPSCLIVAQKSQ